MKLLQNARILAIDDELLNLMMLEDFLLSRCQQLWVETDINAALTLAQQQQPDVILLDIMMEGMDGYQVCQKLKENPATSAIPVIFLSSLTRPSDKVKGFQVGGVDYISKPFHIEEVIARVENAIRLHWQIYQTQAQLVKNIQKTVESYHLTEREVEVLTLYAQGKSRSAMAEKMEISEETVKFHLKNLFIKLKVENRVQVVHKAREIGLIDFTGLKKL